MKAVCALSVLVLTGRAEAHALRAAYRVLPGNRVQIQAWFDPNEAARGAAVKVTRPDGRIVAEGVLDADGLWAFSCAEVSELRVSIRDESAHQANLTIGANDLETPVPWREVLTGVGFCLALAAFLLSVRNARELRSLRRTSTG